MKEFSTQHDLHCHSILSSCTTDEQSNFHSIVAYAEQAHYDTLCLTNHLWDGDPHYPGLPIWYAAQNIAHIQRALPKPHSDSVRVLFGCEAEYCGGKNLALQPEHFDLFDFIVIPLNHMHFIGLVRPREVDTEEKMADLVLTRMEEIQKLPLPFHKVGIAHPVCSLVFSKGNPNKVYALMDEDRLYRIFRGFAQKGVGIELNGDSFNGWQQDGPEAKLKQYRIAKAAGCKFYCGSDAHNMNEHGSIARNLPSVVKALGLTEADRYIVPER